MSSKISSYILILSRSINYLPNDLQLNMSNISGVTRVTSRSPSRVYFSSYGYDPTYGYGYYHIYTVIVSYVVKRCRSTSRHILIPLNIDALAYLIISMFYYSFMLDAFVHLVICPCSISMFLHRSMYSCTLNND